MRFYKILTVAILILLFSAACSSKPASVPLPSPTPLTASTNTPVPPAPTAAPPTLTPTPTPTTGPKDALIAAAKEFLLSSADPDRQEMYNYPQYVEELDLDGNHSYLIHWWMAGLRSLHMYETITIAQQPWGNVPEENLPGSERYGAIPMAGDSPLVGQSSQAFEADDKSLVGFAFIKGNALVTIYALNFTLDEVTNLGRLIEMRLPESFPALPPISFPDQLDPSVFDQYFEEVTLGGHRSGGGVEPLAIFPGPGFVAWDFVEKPNAPWVLERNFDTPMWETAVYDLQANRYIFKNTAIYGGIAGDKSACGTCRFPPGKYEFKLAMKDVLVASIPFEFGQP